MTKQSKIEKGEFVYYEGRKYIAGKHEADGNLRYLHDIKTGLHSEDHIGNALKVNETRIHTS